MRKRILCAQVQHETNSFSRLATGLDAFRVRDLHLGEAAIAANRGTATEMGAFIDAAERFGWELIPALAADATPGGLVTAEAWEYFATALEETARAHGPFDGFLLSLHGAMVAEGHPCADLDLVARLRHVVGPDPVGIASFDLHGNLDLGLADHLDGLTVYRTYPHVDVYACGMAAAELLERALRTGHRPRLVIRRLALLDGCDHGRSSGVVMPRLIETADALRSAQEDIVAVFAGFPWADVPHTGPSVAITTYGDIRDAERAAEPLLADIWRTRGESSLEPLSPAEAMAQAQALALAGKRVVIADFSDNPGGGGYGDATALIAEAISRPGQRVAVASLWDPRAVVQAEAAGVGASLRLSLGGGEPAFGGPPLDCTATILRVGDGAFHCEGPIARGKLLDLGRTATLRIGHVDIIVASNRYQVTDRNHFRIGGIEPADIPILIVKSLQHFRAAFAPLADVILFADSGGLVSRDFTRFPYRHVRRPIWPLDRI